MPNFPVAAVRKEIHFILAEGIETFSGRDNSDAVKSLEGLEVLFVFSHQKISFCGQRALKNPVVLIMCENSRKRERWSDDRGDRVYLGKGFPYLGLRPSESVPKHRPQLSFDRRTEK